MKTRPRNTFEKPVVVTTVPCIPCARCNNPFVKVDTFPPAGAIWNPPAARLTAAELRPRPAHCTCWECGWSWFPNGEAPGHYLSRQHKLANHDPGDEDRR